MSDRETPGRRRLVVVFSTLFVRGGIQRFNQALCEALNRLAPELGIDCVVIAPARERENVDRPDAPWENLRLVETRSKADTAAKAAAAILSRRTDALLIAHLHWTPLGLLLAPFVRRGYAFVAHGLEVWAIPSRLQRIGARRARFVYAVSMDTGRSAVRSAGVSPSRIRLLPNVLPRPLAVAPEGDGAAPGGALEILSVARLDAQERMKGVVETLEAFARLQGKFPTARYRIVGDGTDRARVEERARALGLSGKVVFERDLSDAELARRYRTCTLFVLPSGQEGFGIVFLEAMRHGKACIGGASGGTPEVVLDGETGLLVPFGDVNALTVALDRMLSDGALRESMGRNGARRVQEHFSFDRLVESVESSLVEWLEPHGA